MPTITTDWPSAWGNWALGRSDQGVHFEYRARLEREFRDAERHQSARKRSICAERPDQSFQFLETIEAKGWVPPSEGVSSDINCAAFHAYVAIALHESGKDASAEEQAMRRFTSKPDFKIVGWSWDEVDTWLKKTKLAPDRKAAVVKIIAELRSQKTP